MHAEHCRIALARLGSCTIWCSRGAPSHGAVRCWCSQSWRSQPPTNRLQQPGNDVADKTTVPGEGRGGGGGAHLIRKARRSTRSSVAVSSASSWEAVTACSAASQAGSQWASSCKGPGGPKARGGPACSADSQAGSQWASSCRGPGGQLARSAPLDPPASTARPTTRSPVRHACRLRAQCATGTHAPPPLRFRRPYCSPPPHTHTCRYRSRPSSHARTAAGDRRPTTPSGSACSPTQAGVGPPPPCPSSSAARSARRRASARASASASRWRRCSARARRRSSLGVRPAGGASGAGWGGRGVGHGGEWGALLFCKAGPNFPHSFPHQGTGQNSWQLFTLSEAREGMVERLVVPSQRLGQRDAAPGPAAGQVVQAGGAWRAAGAGWVGVWGKKRGGG